ncbi:MAG: TIGR01244 family phosphatase, partial [Gammaproteobacteria bacterium]|nr:TIGR01244 family phosphatase [Gammaproteobacteria bacterium]NNL50912.1 TIGR01244 family phosphatase [Woeseiaceae bacterium]
DDVEALQTQGYATIVCNRPDGEDFGQPTAASVATACEELNMAFHNLPVDRAGITAEMVERFRKIVAESNGPVLAYCHSGHRSSVLWQASGSP